MPLPLPRLRTNLEFMPSPLQDQPGLLIRDSFQYSDTTLIVPPLLAQCLALFDGKHTDLDLREALVRLTGDLRVGQIQEQLIQTLSAGGFLEDEVYARRREARHKEFRESPVRLPAHAGSGYPLERDALSIKLREYMRDGRDMGSEEGLFGIAAPHVSPEGGWESYRDAYSMLRPSDSDRTFVILGTSHFGEPQRFGLTRKPFVTPLGEAVTEVSLVDQLASAAGDSVIMEDYCHAIEHSIEFQIVFLQHVYGPGIRILPILCGSFFRSVEHGGRPEDDEHVRRFLGALGELAAREGKRLFWVLGIDMAHMGRRYGDGFAATADRDVMVEVARRDRARIERVSAGDAPGFWELVQERHDDLKWCGSSPLYTFLKAAPEARARLLRYQQWNIDPQSVVSFAALSFAGRS